MNQSRNQVKSIESFLFLNIALCDAHVALDVHPLVDGHLQSVRYVQCLGVFPSTYVATIMFFWEAGINKPIDWFAVE